MATAAARELPLSTPALRPTSPTRPSRPSHTLAGSIILLPSGCRFAKLVCARGAARPRWAQQEVDEKLAEHSEPTMVTAAVVTAGLLKLSELFVDSSILYQNALGGLDELR